MENPTIQLDQIKIKVEKLIMLHDKLYEQNLLDFFYWDYWPFKVYESNYAKRLEIYLKEYCDSNELEFI